MCYKPINSSTAFLTYSVIPNFNTHRTLHRNTNQFHSHFYSSSKRVSITFPSCTLQYGPGSIGHPLTDEQDGQHRIHIVFVHPQIHWNTGNIGRTCLGLGATLHLIKPLGFSLDEKQIRRAGLDYWQYVNVNVYQNWNQFVNGKMKQLQGKKYFFTKFGKVSATNIKWPKKGKIVLIFGSEVDGFDGIRDWMDQYQDTENNITVAFPMVDDRFRSFNLSTSASMALWDAYKFVTSNCSVS